MQKFAKEKRMAAGFNAAEVSVDLMIAPVRDVERERLEDVRNQLEKERVMFSDAAIQLGRDRALLQVSFMCCYVIISVK